MKHAPTSPLVNIYPIPHLSLRSIYLLTVTSFMPFIVNELNIIISLSLFSFLFKLLLLLPVLVFLNVLSIIQLFEKFLSLFFTYSAHTDVTLISYALCSIR